MHSKIIIRHTEQDDQPSLETLYREAFSEEDLFPLVQELLADTQNTTHLSAILDGAVVGHIAFTKCHATPEDVPLALLGPMAVLPAQQKQGIGSRLIQEGITILREQAVVKLLVLGDPNYYGRSGFVQEQDIEPAYPIPEAWKPAWQSIMLSDRAASASGLLQVPAPWQRPELWSE